MPDGANVGPTHGGVAVDGAGNVYVSTEANHGVVKFSGEGKFVKSFGGRDESPSFPGHW